MPNARCRLLGGAGWSLQNPPQDLQPAVDRLEMPAEAISVQSSNAWEAYAAASAFGMGVVWCHRYKRLERLPEKPDREIASLEELPGLVGV